MKANQLAVCKTFQRKGTAVLRAIDDLRDTFTKEFVPVYNRASIAEQNEMQDHTVTWIAAYYGATTKQATQRIRAGYLTIDEYASAANSRAASTLKRLFNPKRVAKKGSQAKTAAAQRTPVDRAANSLATYIISEHLTDAQLQRIIRMAKEIAKTRKAAAKAKAAK